LSKVSEFSFLRSDEIRIAKGIFKGSGIFTEGLELDRDIFRSTVCNSRSIAVKERLEPVVGCSVEVSRGKKDFLGFSCKEFRLAEEVMSTLGEVEIDLVTVS
jgi:hypothetical protein